MTVVTIDSDTSAHPLEPVRAAVLDISHGSPLLTLGADADAVWYPGGWLADPTGPALPGVLDTVAQRWGLGRHAAAAIAFKGYAWAATLPVLAGWLRHRRIPLMDSARLHVGVASALPYIRFDLLQAEFAVEPDDQFATHDAAAVAPAEFLAEQARASLLGGHLADVIAALHALTRVGERLLWGSVAEAVAYGTFLLRPDEAATAARRVLAEIGGQLTDLVEISDGPDGPAVRRRTCCLWFTGEAGRGEYCSTCCVVPLPSPERVRSGSWPAPTSS